MEHQAVGDAGQTPRIGALGQEIVKVQALRQGVVLVVTAAVTIAAAWFGLPAGGAALAPVIGPVATIWVLAVASVLALALACAVVAAVPPLLLDSDDRAAAAVHSWVGAREVRRVLGSATAATSVPTSPEEAERWLAATPSTDRLRPIRIEALLLARRFDEARVEAAMLPDGTALDRYRRLEADALIDDQAGQAIDEAGLRQAIAAIPPGVDRAEAAGSLAIILARRAVPTRQWRRPLVQVRPLIPGSDAGILLRDLAVPVWILLVRWVVLPTAFIIVAVAVFATLSAPPV